jgi:hypothetical protein
MSMKLIRRVMASSLLVGSLGVIAAAGVLPIASATSSGAATRAVTLVPKSTGELDCNGYSPVQTAVKHSMLCTDIRGFAGVSNPNNYNSRFYDNGVYIGHDEPDMTFISSTPGSGDNVTWNETLGVDPTAAPTDKTPGTDVSHYFELTPAPWFSMAMCDSNSYPQTSCTPESDANAPTGRSIGGGSAFMEMQLYPPGMAPFVDSSSCDNTHWCSALTIDSLECTSQFAQCNPKCEEPVNFAFVQRNGVPSGPPSPQDADLSTETPNSETLLMNPGDQIRVHMFDAPAPGGGHAFEVVVDDLTTHQSGTMQASAANGFANTSIISCDGTPTNFQPEYSTAGKSEIIPWAALQTNISTEFETGHFEACTSITKESTYTVAPGVTDNYWNECHGPYENAGGSEGTELSDAFCYPQGDTHGVLDSTPDTITGCEDDLVQNGDLDFDGTPYWTEWPTGTTPTATYPSSFVQKYPTTNGTQYGNYFVQTDVALSESTCSGTTTAGCSVPPPGPGLFYPYWSRVDNAGQCSIEFGNVAFGAGVNNLNGDAQYGTDKIATLGYPEYEGPLTMNSCKQPK